MIRESEHDLEAGRTSSYAKTSNGKETPFSFPFVRVAKGDGFPVCETCSCCDHLLSRTHSKNQYHSDSNFHLNALSLALRYTTSIYLETILTERPTINAKRRYLIQPRTHILLVANNVVDYLRKAATVATPSLFRLFARKIDGLR